MSRAHLIADVPSPQPITTRLAALDWERIGTDLDAAGCAPPVRY
jgi:hypothetical protein